MIGSPLIVLALHIPLLPCILLRGTAGRRQQRVVHAALQMEEGRRTNQRYIDAANAEAARLAAERAALGRAAPLEALYERDGTGGDAGGSPLANDPMGNDMSTANDTSKDTPRYGGAAKRESIPGNDIAGAVAPPAPAHIDR